MATRKLLILLLAGMPFPVANVAIAQPGSVACKNAQHAVTTQQNKITAFEQTKNSSQYRGSAVTVYQNTLKQMQDQLASVQAGEEIACSATGAAALQGDIRPKYMILTLIYAPPGTAGGKASSFVDYSTGSTLGSTVDVAHAFKTDYSITAGLTVGGGFASASVSVSGEWTEQQTTTNEYKVDSSAKIDEKVPGPSTDGIDHGYDEFILWLNPIIHVTVQGKKLTYTPGVDGPALQQIYVYASELKNPAIMRPDVAAALKARGLTIADYNTILNADPFANGSAAINTNRFIQTSTTLPYEPPLTATDLPNVTTYSVTNDSTSTTKNENTGSSGVTVTASVTAGVSGIATATVSTKDSWTWTQTNTTSNSSGSTSSATVAIGDPSYGYKGTISQIAVYSDTIYNSFMFAAVPVGVPFSTGILYDPNHKPLPGQKVVLTVPGRTFQTYTDRNGEYKFYGLPRTATMTGTLTTGTTKQTLTIGPKPIKHDISISKK